MKHALFCSDAPTLSGAAAILRNNCAASIAFTLKASTSPTAVELGSDGHRAKRGVSPGRLPASFVATRANAILAAGHGPNSGTPQGGVRSVRPGGLSRQTSHVGAAALLESAGLTRPAGPAIGAHPHSGPWAYSAPRLASQMDRPR